MGLGGAADLAEEEEEDSRLLVHSFPFCLRVRRCARRSVSFGMMGHQDIAGIGSALTKIAFDILRYRWDREDLLLGDRNRGLVFLLDVQHRYGRR